VKLLKLRFLPRRGVYELTLEGGEKLLAQPESAGELHEGGDVPAGALQRLLRESAYLVAREVALKALSRREHFTSEISNRLERKLVPEEIARQIVSELQDDGYLDDDRAAEVFVKERVSRGVHGPFRVISELVRRGYPKDAAREVVRRMMPERYEVEMLERFVKKSRRSFRERLKREEEKLLQDHERVRKMGGRAAAVRHLCSKHLEKVRARLVAAGFSSELASRAAKEIILGRQD